MKEDDIQMHLKASLPQPNFLAPMAVIAPVSGKRRRVLRGLKIILLILMGVVAALLSEHKDIFAPADRGPHSCIGSAAMCDNCIYLRNFFFRF